MIYSINEMQNVAATRGPLLRNDFFTYSFHMPAYTARQHNGKVFGVNMMIGYCGEDYLEFRCERLNRMLPPESAINEE